MSSLKAIFELRREELRRRVDALPREIQAWKNKTKNDLDSNLHYSQLQAIGILMDTFLNQQKQLINQINVGGSPAAFQEDSWNLLKSIVQSQQVWDFFRDKLDLRYSPTYKDVLWVADTVAWDCYRPVLDDATGKGILDHSALREPPLTYLSADVSPLIWVRDSRPNDGNKYEYERDYYLGKASLPIPVIQIPWDHVENLWELMSLHHEVGHCLEADLKLSDVLADTLQAELTNNGVPQERIQQWLRWQGEVFADLVAIQLGGPAFTESLSHQLLLPTSMVMPFIDKALHPIPYLRVLLNTAYIPTIIPSSQNLINYSQQITDKWINLYGRDPFYNSYITDFSFVFKALMDTPLPVLRGYTVRELMPYRPVDDLLIQNAVGFMQTGMNKPGKNLQPRHCISAARLAITQAADSAILSDNLMNSINERVSQLVKSNAAEGLRSGDSSAPHKKFIASFVNAGL